MDLGALFASEVILPLSTGQLSSITKNLRFMSSASRSSSVIYLTYIKKNVMMN